MGKRILLVAATTGYQTREFAAAGERAGYDVQLATDHCPRLGDAWGDGAIPIKFHKPEVSTSAILREVERSGPFDGVVAVGDRPAYVAAVAARQLGLPYHSPESVFAAWNKYHAREQFRTAGLPVPGFRRIAIDGEPDSEAAQTRYPCVLKPLGLSASRGVIRADNKSEFSEAFHRIRAILTTRDIARKNELQDRFLQVEDYIEGQEFALEGLLTHGRFHPIALFDKPDPLVGPYFEETLYVTPSRAPDAVQDAIVGTTRRALAALGLSHGPVHAEMRVNDQGVWMLEVAARPIGGLCAKALRFESGWNLEDIVMRHAAGDPVGSLALDAPGRGVMMIPIPRGGFYQGVRGADAARVVPGIEDILITAKEGQHLLPLPDGASYLGFIFASGASPGFVENALRGAHQRLEFEIRDALPIV